MEMEPQEVTDNKQRNQKNGKVFLIAIVLGILLGVGVTVLVLEVMRFRKPIVVKVENDKSDSKGSNDTIVKYVVHRYENRSMLYDDQLQPIDSLSQDTLYAEGYSEDLTMEDAAFSTEDGTVVGTHVLSEMTCKVIALDNEKKELSAAEHGTLIHVLFLDTPIKNKNSYLFNAGTLKIKGLPVGAVKFYLYKNTVYMVHNRHTYPLTPNSQFEKLVEDRDITF